MSKTIHSSIPKDVASPSSIKYFSPIQKEDLPKPFTPIPSQCTNLSQIAKYEIQTLQRQEEQLHTIMNNNSSNDDKQQYNATATATASSSTYTSNEIQNAIDDGFLLCDLNVIRRKLMAWRIMFPRIKPFFAIKCNPDSMVSHVLGRTYYNYCIDSSNNRDDDNGYAGAGDGTDTDTSADSITDNTTNNTNKDVCGFDCASLAEIQLALQCSHSNNSNNNNNNYIQQTKTNNNNILRKKSIVYANPQRAIYDLDNSLELGVNALTFDSVEELQKVKNAYDRLVEKKKQIITTSTTTAKSSSSSAAIVQPPEMILRILVPDTNSTVPLGEKFGVDPMHVQKLTAKALELGLDVIGVSFHCGSGNHDPDSYKEAILIAKSCIDEINVVLKEHGKDECCILDIGGGYPGYDGVGADFFRFASVHHTFDNDGADDDGSCDGSSWEKKLLSKQMSTKYDPSTETAYKIAQVVSPLIDELYPPNESKMDIISEPGRYFVEAAFAYCAKIYSVKTTTDERSRGEEGVVERLRYHYYIAQGVQGLFKDVILCNEVFTPIPLHMSIGNNNSGNSEQHEEEWFISVVHGPSGESFDIVCSECLLPKLNVGDWLLFDRMGAYTMSIAARNRNLSVRYVC